MDLGAAILAGGLLSAGWTLDSGPGAWVGGEVRVAWFSLGAEARGIFAASPKNYLVAPTSPFASFSGLVVPCLRWKVLLGCGFVELGKLMFELPATVKSEMPGTVLSFGPRAAVHIPLLFGFSARGFADLAIHPYRHSLDDVIAGLASAGKSEQGVKESAVSAFFGVGIGWSP